MLHHSTNPADWPRHLPRLAKTYRLFIEHPVYPRDRRMLTGEPTSDFYRVMADDAPHLAKAGPLSFIASSIEDPYGWNRHLIDPRELSMALFWHWMGRDSGGWVIQATKEMKRLYAAEKRIDVSLIDLPPTNGPA